jgi:hypothetical protein
MRILGFSKKWGKLNQPKFTTFRYSRMDKDWYTGEEVQIYYKPRSISRRNLGIAKIIMIEPRELDKEYYELCKGDCAPLITEIEAKEDGFESIEDMIKWMQVKYGHLDWMPRMNKLTLEWEKRNKTISRLAP